MSDIVGKLNDAVDLCEDNLFNEAPVEFTYSELRYLRTLVLADELRLSEAGVNLRACRKLQLEIERY